MTLSARWSPGTRSASRADRRAAPPYAASTCSHSPSRRGERRQLRHQVDGARVGRPGDGGDGHRPKACGAIAGNGVGDGRGVEPERVVGGDEGEGLGREAELVEGPGDREVGLVAGVDADALERRPARRSGGAGERPEVHVADEGQRDEVGHDAARRQQPEAALAVPHEVAQPAPDLLLDERGDGTRVPDVDALVGPLGEHLADDRGDQRRRREVAERARVEAVQRVGGDPGRELVEDGLERGRLVGRPAGFGGLPEVGAAQLRVAGRQAHRADHGPVVEPVERRRPGRLAGPLEGLARGRGVADADELGLRVPAERGEGVVAIVRHRSVVARRMVRRRAAHGVNRPDPRAPRRVRPRSRCRTRHWCGRVQPSTPGECRPLPALRPAPVAGRWAPVARRTDATAPPTRASLRSTRPASTWRDPGPARGLDRRATAPPADRRYSLAS